MSKPKKEKAVKAVEVGKVYAIKSLRSRQTHRRVIAVLQGRVFYSTGGNRNFDCTVKTFFRYTDGVMK